MSYDIRIWSANKIDFRDEYLQKIGFKVSESFLIYESKDWQIIISESCEVDEEDIEPEIFSLLPGIKYMIEINLEPIFSPKKAMQLLMATSKYIAKSTSGVIVDEQADIIQTPSGIKRVESFKTSENKKSISMSWWFNDDSKLRKDGLRELINLIDLMIPEAMPRRYDLYEPPKYKYSETGKEHFIQFMYDNLTEGVVWYPNKPFEFVSIISFDDLGPTHLGYRFGYIVIDFYEEVMKQAGWPLTLKRFWLKASEIINPVFGHVISGMEWRCCWWNGIPRELEKAVIIGHHPYIELWPQFTTKANKTESGLYYIENIIENNIDMDLIEIDEDLIEPEKVPYPPGISIYASSEEKEAWEKACDEARKNKYPEVWPFEEPFKK